MTPEALRTVIQILDKIAETPYLTPPDSAAAIRIIMATPQNGRLSSEETDTLFEYGTARIAKLLDYNQ